MTHTLNAETLPSWTPPLRIKLSDGADPSAGPPGGPAPGGKLAPQGSGKDVREAGKEGGAKGGAAKTAPSPGQKAPPPAVEFIPSLEKGPPPLMQTISMVPGVTLRENGAGAGPYLVLPEIMHISGSSISVRPSWASSSQQFQQPEPLLAGSTKAGPKPENPAGRMTKVLVAQMHRSVSPTWPAPTSELTGMPTALPPPTTERLFGHF